MTTTVSLFQNQSMSFSSVLYSPTMKEDPSDEILNGDKRSAHNALERQRREGLNNKFQQLAHVLPGLQNIRRPSKSMIVTKSLEFVSKSVQRDMSYQNKIKQLRKEYNTLRKHTLQQQKSAKKMKRPQQPTSPTKRLPAKSPIRHKFVHHHASASSPQNQLPSPPPQPQPQPQQMTAVYPTPVFQDFTSWPPLDLSGVFMDPAFLTNEPQPSHSYASYWK